MRLVSMNLKDNVHSWFKHISFTNWKYFKYRLYVRFGNVKSQYSPIAVSGYEVILVKESFQEATSPKEDYDVIVPYLVQQKILLSNVDLSCVLEDLTSAVLVNKQFQSHTKDMEAWMVQKLEQLQIFSVSDVATSDTESPSVKTKTVACQVFDKMLLKEHLQQKIKQDKGSKCWKFKYKHEGDGVKGLHIPGRYKFRLDFEQWFKSMSGTSRIGNSEVMIQDGMLAHGIKVTKVDAVLVNSTSEG